MHAFEDIAGLYREELRSLREDAVRFAVRNPGMARQLGLASDTQPDLWLICCWSRSHGLPPG